MIFLWIALGALALWVTFIYAPSFVMYRMIFSRRPITSPDEESLSETPLAPHTAEIMRDMAYLETLSPETVTVTAGDGTPLGGRYFRRGGGKSVIFFHGYNTHPMKNFAVHARLFIEHGYDALVVFERGHGESGGAHNGMGLLERGDVPAWIEKARELSPGCRIVLYGMSMGAFAVAMASGSLDPADACCAVIDCGFSSPYKQLAHDAAMRRLPTLLLMPLISLHARSFMHIDLRETAGDALSRSKIPSLFLHGDADTTVPIADGVANCEACAAEKEFIAVAGAAHTAALPDGGGELMKKVIDFADAHADAENK